MVREKKAVAAKWVQAQEKQRWLEFQVRRPQIFFGAFLCCGTNYSEEDFLGSQQRGGYASR
jgi:hypothetical protein